MSSQTPVASSARLTQEVWLKTVVTALGSFPTGTEIADAVTGYSLAAAQTI